MKKLLSTLAVSALSAGLIALPSGPAGAVDNSWRTAERICEDHSDAWTSGWSKRKRLGGKPGLGTLYVFEMWNLSSSYCAVTLKGKNTSVRHHWMSGYIDGAAGKDGGKGQRKEILGPFYSELGFSEAYARIVRKDGVPKAARIRE